MSRATIHGFKQLAVERDYRTYLIVDFVLGFAAGFIYSLDRNGDLPQTVAKVAYYGVEALGFGSTFMALAAADLDWGWPEMSNMHQRRPRELLMCMWMLGITATWAVWYRSVGNTAQFVLVLVGAPSLLCGIRGWPLLFWAICALISPYVYLWTSDQALAVYLVAPLANPAAIKLALMFGACAKLRYLHDQRLAACICILPVLAWVSGVLFNERVLNGGGGVGDAVIFGLYFAMGFASIFINLLLRRRRRSLPPGLQGVRFVRLGFLREMLCKGEKIRRCQDLPDEAFGDASKAIHLIVLSHRWHDQSTCDVTSPNFPHGVKLANLVRRLDAHFLPSRTGRLWHRLCCWYRLCCIGGWDVVLFFDFLSIPQNGIAEDGSIIERTYEEQEIFDDCLPNMGTLYSLFPVLALPDVPEGDTDHNYIDSGWCLCEFTIAMLTQQLTPYSEQMLSSFGRRSLIDASMNSMDGRAAQRFQRTAVSELECRPFYHESDRKVAGGIIEGFLTKRVLADSIRRGDLGKVQRLLKQLKRDDLLDTLHEPVDGGLNTLLHIAVQSRNVYVVMALLLQGARPNLRNLRGDTPGQWFLFPRLSAAAVIVRAASRGLGECCEITQISTMMSLPENEDDKGAPPPTLVGQFSSEHEFV